MAKGYIKAVFDFINEQCKVEIPLLTISQMTNIPQATLDKAAREGVIYWNKNLQKILGFYNLKLEELSNKTIDEQSKAKVVFVQNSIEAKQDFLDKFSNFKVDRYFKELKECHNFKTFYIATPMSSIENLEFIALQENVTTLSTFLTQKGKKVYSNILHYQAKEDFKKPGTGFSATNCQKIWESDVFLLLYPHKVSSGVLVELGLALSQGKHTIVYCNNKKDLPTMITDWQTRGYNSDRLSIVEIEDFNSLHIYLEQDSKGLIK